MTTCLIAGRCSERQLTKFSGDRLWSVDSAEPNLVKDHVPKPHVRSPSRKPKADLLEMTGPRRLGLAGRMLTFG